MESVVALFKEPQQAARALEALKANGFQREALGFALTDVTTQEDIARRTGVAPEAGMPAGSAAVIKGAALGTLGGLIMTVPVWGLLALWPATQMYVDGGKFAALFGAIGGLTLGGLFGSLAGSDHGDYVRLLRGFGIPAEQAEGFYRRMQGGETLVIARDPDPARADEASVILRRMGAASLDSADNQGVRAEDETQLASEGRQDMARAENERENAQVRS